MSGRDRPVMSRRRAVRWFVLLFGGFAALVAMDLSFALLANAPLAGFANLVPLAATAVLRWPRIGGPDAPDGDDGRPGG